MGNSFPLVWLILALMLKIPKTLGCVVAQTPTPNPINSREPAVIGWRLV